MYLLVISPAINNQVTINAFWVFLYYEPDFELLSLGVL